MEDIIIVGYGGHGKSVEDAIISMKKYNIVGYVDSRDYKDENIAYLGGDDILKEIFNKGVHNAVIGIGYMGNSNIRDILYKKLSLIGYSLPVIIDASAIIAENVKISEGTFVGKKAVINSSAYIGKMTIINTGCIVEHESVIEDFAHIAVGAVLCGNVHIGDHTFVGASSTIIQGIHVGSRVIIGAGSVIIKDVDNKSTVIGVPGRRMKNNA